MTRVQFTRPVASPTLSATAGQILDLDDDEAQRRIDAGHCTPLDEPGKGRLIDRVRRALTPDPDSGDDKPLEKRTVEQLKAFAAAREIDLGDASKKAEILDAITTELARREGEADDT